MFSLFKMTMEIHLLGKRINLLKIYYSDYNPYDRINQYRYFQDISSEPSLPKVFELLQYLSYYIDFSIKNKEEKAIDEFHNNILLRNICFAQMLLKKKNKFPSKRPSNEYYSSIAYIKEWNDLFKLKDPKQKNRTLLHYIFMGDRLNAIKFLVDQGADVNYRKKEKNNYGKIIDGPIPISKLFIKKGVTIYDENKYNFIPLIVPSGFRKIPIIKTGWPSDYQDLLDQREKRILEETEKIVEYLIESGTNLTLDMYFPMCDYSDVAYRAYKIKNAEKTSSVIDKIKNLSKRTLNTLMDYSCFPFGNNDKNIHYKNKEVKYIKLISNNNKDRDEVEN